MGKKKRSAEETETILAEENAASIDLSEETPVSSELIKNLSKLCKPKTVLGYIFRDSNTATIDLKEPEKLVEYAMLTSQAVESAQEFANVYPVGELQSILIEGKDLKALCIIMGENRISIFMKKDVDHEDLLNRVTATKE